MTPYQLHETLDHGPMGRHSPNGIDVIEECDKCGARFLHNPCIGYPVSMSYMPVTPTKRTTCRKNS